ncbi:pilin [Massilia sp. CCM 8734]|uniref:pilin n=1 Tax=Massilia sp. CCM 8734 TaxID=2609283 RepID=UPI001421E472|nr:pilin [Massilia sp. CCM 8734]NHZ97708.1 hypothetical protein [Massilia sp. CCM 8734]
MKCFLKGVLGALCVLVLAAVIIPQYSGYRARAETGKMLVELGAVQYAIEADAVKRGTFAGTATQLTQALPVPSNVTLFEVNDTGVIVAKGGRNGQMIILSPLFVDGKIQWRCIGAPDKDMPDRCTAVAR